MLEPIVVTTGIYDAIKDHLRRKKVSIEAETLLADELKNAKQVLRRDLPENIVTVNKIVKVKDHTDNEEKEYIFVPSTKEKIKKNKHSILSDMALATIGYPVGTVLEYPFPDGEKKIEILSVEDFNA